MKNNKLENKAKQATEILQGKTLRLIWRHTDKQVGIEFTDGPRLFVDHQPSSVEISITGS